MSEKYKSGFSGCHHIAMNDRRVDEDIPRSRSHQGTIHELSVYSEGPFDKVREVHDS